MKHILFLLYFITVLNYSCAQNIFLERFDITDNINTEHLEKYSNVDPTQKIKTIKVYEYSTKSLYKKDKLPKKKGVLISGELYDKKGRLLQFLYNVKRLDALLESDEYKIVVSHENQNRTTFKKFYKEKLLASWTTENQNLTNYTEYKSKGKILRAYSFFYKCGLVEKIEDAKSKVYFSSTINEDSTYLTTFLHKDDGDKHVEKYFYDENKNIIRKEILGSWNQFNVVNFFNIDKEVLKIESSESNIYKVFKHDDQNRIIETLVYKKKNDKLKEKTTYAYNSDGEIVQEILYEKNKIVKKITSSYLENGLLLKRDKKSVNRISIWYEPNFTQENIYNEDGLLVKIICDTEHTERKYVFTIDYTFFEND